MGRREEFEYVLILKILNQLLFASSSRPSFCMIFS